MANFFSTISMPSYEARDEAALYWAVYGGTIVPVLSDTCGICGRRAAPEVLTRIGGNSVNGYEPMHEACLTA